MQKLDLFNASLQASEFVLNMEKNNVKKIEKEIKSSKNAELYIWMTSAAITLVNSISLVNSQMFINEPEYFKKLGILFTGIGLTCAVANTKSSREKRKILEKKLNISKQRQKELNYSYGLLKFEEIKRKK